MPRIILRSQFELFQISKMLISDISIDLLISRNRINDIKKPFLISEIKFLDFRSFFISKNNLCILIFKKIDFFNIRKQDLHQLTIEFINVLCGAILSSEICLTLNSKCMLRIIKYAFYHLCQSRVFGPLQGFMRSGVNRKP